MLRLLVLLLLLANLLFFAWAEGWLGEAGNDLRGDKREPQRLARQLHPESIQIVAASAPARAAAETPDAGHNVSGTAPADGASGPPVGLVASAPVGLATSAASATFSTPAVPAAPDMPTGPAASSPLRALLALAGGASSATAAPAGAASAAGPSAQNGAPRCLEAGPFTAAQRKDAETALAAVLGERRWQVRSQEKPGLWMVYMGRFDNDETLKQKMDELRRITTIRVDFSEVRTPPELAPGLSLGRFQQRANAETALVALRSHGVRTARIVTVRQPQAQFFVRLPRALAADQQALVGLSGVLAGQRFTACPATP